MSKYVSVLAMAALAVTLCTPALAQRAVSRIAGPIDEGNLRSLPRNTHPLARPSNDNGAAPADLALDRMLLVLTPSAERQAALATFLSSQQDKSSKQYHKWLTPGQFGQQFGVGDSDITAVTGWLKSHGFTVNGVSNGRNLVDFSGTAGQVQQAFHTTIHKYVVNGQEHWANDSDPQIPVALAPVVAGVSTLHNFRKASQIAALKRDIVKTSTATGSQPTFTASDGEHALAPADFATIYNLEPTYSQGINGTGTTIAVVGRTNITMQDIQDFKNSFGVPANLPQVVLNGTDPGNLGGGDEAEAVLDASWSAALAPNATVKLVVSASTNTTDGVDLSEQYIVNNNLADVMTESYGDCEANYTQAEAQFYSNLAQQAAAEGITYTVASGDSGATGCDDPGSVTVASGPVSVNILAATPYDIAVGGTQFNEGSNTAFWTTSNDGSFASAQSYIPEVVWNESCTVAKCGSTNAGIWAGGGGASLLFAKPSWQSGVVGIPNDGARDVPDVSFSSAGHDFYLLCLDGSCTTRRGQSSFSGVSGTSAATPSFAAVMALVVQYAGGRQGQAATTLYKLASGGTLSSCNSADPAVACIFNDITAGNNAVPGEVGYGTSNASYQAGVGYDLATGLGSMNVSNLVTGWNGGGVTTPQVRVGIDSPSPQNATVIGLTTFSGWALADTGSVTSVVISIDSVMQGSASYGSARTDICALYGSSNCPNVGWLYPVETASLADGSHALGVTVTSSSGQVYTASASFTVANWTSANPMKMNIDTPSTGTQSFNGTAFLAGWAINDQSAVSQVAVSIDGVPSGLAVYGGSRPDVCAALPGRAGCPNVGWNFTLDTTKLTDGAHAVAITPSTNGGQRSTVSRNFVVANNPGNVMTVSVDNPGAQSGTFSGTVGFSGWAITTAVPISSIAITIDGLPYGNAAYGGSRPDVCTAYAGRPGCPNVGWRLVVDTTQLVNGLHVLGVAGYTPTGQHQSVSRTFTASNGVSASPIQIFIDQPNPQNAIFLGQTTFRGWAISDSITLNSVSIAIDGASYGKATYHLSRPDVCQAFPTSLNCPNEGWTFPVDTSRLANGSHILTVTAAGSQQNTLSAQFAVANWTTANPMKIAIDNPSTQSGPLSGNVGIGGWAVDQLAAIQKVSIAVDGNSLGNSYYGGSRGDVCTAIGGAIGCPNVGWNFFLDTMLLSDGPHTLAVTGTTVEGQSSTFTTAFQVANGGKTEVHVTIDAPSPGGILSGTSPIGGWALNANGAQIVSVVIAVDGVVNGTAFYGGSRADVCAIFTSGGGCPNVGWNYELDTSPFGNGGHVLEARALAADGSLYTAATAIEIANQP